MSEQQQAISTEEAEEREFEDAAQAFFENEGNPEEAAADMQADMARTEKEETAKKYQDILVALGFARYDNKEKGIAYKLKAGPLQIGRTFTEIYPIGNMWVRYLSDCEYGKKDGFMKKDKCKDIPIVKLFYRIRDGELPIPEPEVIGKVVGKSEKAVQIQFDEFGQIEKEWWGFKAVYSSAEGVKYIPASYSKETEKYNLKMQVPRDIVLGNYEAELEEAPLVTQTDTTEEKEAQEEKVKKGTIADKIPHKDPVPLAEGEKPTVDYYIGLIGEITAKVKIEERISKGEQGYAISKVFDAITKDKRVALIAELKRGNHKEQA